MTQQNPSLEERGRSFYSTMLRFVWLHRETTSISAVVPGILRNSLVDKRKYRNQFSISGTLEAHHIVQSSIVLLPQKCETAEQIHHEL
jgi:hypothetical protein